MTTLFDEHGSATPATLLVAGPCYVTQIKTLERDGYQAVQLGYEDARRLNKAEQGHLKQVRPLRHLREFRSEQLDDVELGGRVDIGFLKPGDFVEVTGTSKGRGFAGVVKRHDFSGGPKTHGQSDRWRRAGSIGSGTTPGRVLKGLRMAGHMGHERVTVKNLRVVQVDPERNLLALRGAVPGPRGGLVIIRKRPGQE